ncbi:hypothetical protein F4803DRAFT_564032 [Xylaria telfairii]|nr:hypothetical protein F4803DRAFT_564032 [Xylaria telfairii]
MEKRPTCDGLWNGAELDLKRHPRFALWSGAKEVIDKHLEDTVKNPGVTVMSVTSPPASGKSTTLVQHISELARTSKAPKRVLYVVSTDVEELYISSWLQAHGILVTSDGVGGVRGVQVVTSETMVKMFTDQKMPWPDHLTIVLDINWYPTVDDEVALALVLHRAGQIQESHRSMDIHMAIVLLMSGFESPRTIHAFRKCTGHILRLSNNEFHQVQLKHLKEGWKGDVRASIGLCKEGRVVYSTGEKDMLSWRRLPFKDVVPVLEARDPSLSSNHTLRTNIDALRNDKVLWACGEMPFAVALNNVTLVLCSGDIGHTTRLDPRITQTVYYERRMTFSEILRVLSWGVRSDQYGSSTNVVFAVPAANYAQLKEQAEPERDDLGNAWNRDLSFLILKIFKIWPGARARKFPTRPFPDFLSFTDRIRGLLVVGCIERHGVGWKCTELGLEILNIWAEMGSVLSFNVVFLLARLTLMVRHSRPRSVVVLVLLHMAAIAQVGSSAFVKVNKISFNLETLIKAFAPIVPEEKRYAGYLWMALGLYLYGCRHGLIDDAVPESKCSEFPEVAGLDVDAEAGTAIAEFASVFAEHLGINLGKVLETNWDRQEPTQDDVAMIDRELMWAWLHRIAMFWPSPLSEWEDQVTDMVSLQRFFISMDKEPMDALRIRQLSNRQNQANGAFYALYEGINLVEKEAEAEDDSGSSAGRWSGYYCQNMTWIPATAFADVEDKSGCIWPDAVGRSMSR